MGSLTLLICSSSMAIPTSAEAKDLAIEKEVCMELSS
jgi:hypothetical protein